MQKFCKVMTHKKKICKLFQRLHCYKFFKTTTIIKLFQVKLIYFIGLFVIVIITITSIDNKNMYTCTKTTTNLQVVDKPFISVLEIFLLQDGSDNLMLSPSPSPRLRTGRILEVLQVIFTVCFVKLNRSEQIYFVHYVLLKSVVLFIKYLRIFAYIYVA